MESAKKLALTAALSQYNKVLVAFSGGIDSTVVLDAALKTLGKENVLAVVANSDLFTDEDTPRQWILPKKWAPLF